MTTVGIKTYSEADDLPAIIPVFPLSGALLLPRTQLPLNIFEPRYLAMIDAAIGQDRVIGMVQPARPHDPSSKPKLHKVGCAGRLTSFQETSDGRYMINLTGIARFEIVEELSATTLYRQCRISAQNFAHDFELASGEEGVDRKRLLDALSRFMKANRMEADWDSITTAPTELLVNALSAMSPFEPRDKQALLEARTLAERAETLITLTEFSLAGDRGPAHLQ